MASPQTKVYTIKIDGVETSIKNVNELKTSISTLDKELETAEFGSDRFKELSSASGKLKQELAKVDEQLSGISSVQKAEGLFKVGEALGGAFATATVAADAFGISGSTLEEAQTRATQLIVALDGVKKITEGLSAENLKFAKASFQSFRQAGIGAKLFGNTTKAAIAATGIGALVVLLGLIIANFDKVKSAVSSAFEGTFVETFVNYITDLVDKVGGLANLFTAVGAGIKGFFDTSTTASEEFNKSLEKGKKIQNLEKESATLKAINEDRARQIKLLEAQGGKEAELFELKRKIFKSELDNIQDLKRAGQELTAEQIQRAKELDTELKLLQINETNRINAAQEKANTDRFAKSLAALKKRFEDEAKAEEEFRKKREENFQATDDLGIGIPSSDLVKQRLNESLKVKNDLLVADNAKQVPFKSVFDYIFGTGDGKVVDEDKQAALQNLISTSIVAYNQAFESILGAIDQRIENTRDRIDSIETETTQTLSNINSLEEQLSTAQGARREQLLQRLQKEQQREVELANTKKRLASQLERDERRRSALRKTQDISQAVANTALGITRALATEGALGIITAAIIGATGALQVATISAQKYAKGGILQGPSHANGGIATPFGEMEGGEAIINKTSTSRFKPILSAINEAGGGVKFADGGITTPNFSSIRSSLPAVNDSAAMFNALTKIKFKIGLDEFTRISDNSNLSEDRSTL